MRKGLTIAHVEVMSISLNSHGIPMLHHLQAFSVPINAEWRKLFLSSLFSSLDLALDSTSTADLQSCQSLSSLV